MKLKECKDWKAVFFNDRTILKKDIKFMSAEQVEALGEVEVKEAKRKGYYDARK